MLSVKVLPEKLESFCVVSPGTQSPETPISLN